MNRSESKYFNTAARMDEAFLALLEQKDFAYITVKELCQKAGVNRSTFYLHYETVGDLLAESVEYMHRQFMAQFSDVADVAGKLRHCPEEELMLLTPDYLRPYLTFIRRHRQLYQTALEKPEIFSADRTYQRMFREIFDPILERFSVPEKERNYRMMFYLNGISAVIAEWLRRDCREEIDEIIAVIRRCILDRREM